MAHIHTCKQNIHTHKFSKGSHLPVRLLLFWISEFDTLAIALVNWPGPESSRQRLHLAQ